MPLLDPHELQRSSVVANSDMNRERGLVGSNGYDRELRLDVLAYLRERRARGPVAWVDLCCGTGRALVAAAAELTRAGEADGVRIEGVDLAGMFDANPYPAVLTLREASLEAWTPNRPYALVTCVHGLHYIGDKLAALAKAAGCLAPDGLFVASVDLANFRLGDGRPAARVIAERLRDCGFEYDRRRRLVSRRGAGTADFGLRYLGADDTTGPNYTGQPAVTSYYEG